MEVSIGILDFFREKHWPLLVVFLLCHLGRRRSRRKAWGRWATSGLKRSARRGNGLLRWRKRRVETLTCLQYIYIIYLQPIWSGHKWTSSYYLASGLTTSWFSLGKGWLHLPKKCCPQQVQAYGDPAQYLECFNLAVLVIHNLAVHVGIPGWGPWMVMGGDGWYIYIYIVVDDTHTHTYIYIYKYVCMYIYIICNM